MARWGRWGSWMFNPYTGGHPGLNSAQKNPRASIPGANQGALAQQGGQVGSIPGGAASTQAPREMPETCVELRWVVTPDLDGPQLQFRAWKIPRNGGIIALDFSDWKPVPFKFQGSKMPNPGETDGNKPADVADKGQANAGTGREEQS